MPMQPLLLRAAAIVAAFLLLSAVAASAPNPDPVINDAMANTGLNFTGVTVCWGEAGDFSSGDGNPVGEFFEPSTILLHRDNINQFGGGNGASNPWVVATVLWHEHQHFKGKDQYCDHPWVFLSTLMWQCEVIEELKLAGVNVKSMCEFFEHGRTMYNEGLIEWWHINCESEGAGPPLPLEACPAC